MAQQYDNRCRYHCQTVSPETQRVELGDYYCQTGQQRSKADTSPFRQDSQTSGLPDSR